MKKIFLIIQREYLSRVKKRTFIVMTILGPLLFASLIILPAYFAMMGDKDLKIVAVCDSAKVLPTHLPETDVLKFKYFSDVPVDTLKKDLKEGKYNAILYIPANLMTRENVVLYSMKQTPLSTNIYITNSLTNIVQNQKLINNKIPVDVVNSIKTDINMSTIRLSEEGQEKKSSAGLSMWLGYAAGLLIYMFIFLFGTQVMRGVIEEKTSRVVEVIVSSVKPFELMMGKIIGIALVGLTQFVLWIILTMGIVTIAQTSFMPQIKKTATQQVVSNTGIQANANAAVMADTTKNDDTKIVKDIFSSLDGVKINIPLILFCFIVYFLGGFLLYGAMFAAVGSAVDNETDTQQFMLPITVPLIVAIIIMVQAMNNPDSSLSYWFSIIPFTSPVVMMTRIPFGVPVTDLVLSIGLLVATFVFMTWFAGRIYKVGILMYGKKVSYKELWKWFRYHN